MIPRPSIEQLLQQCRRDIMTTVIPQVTDDTTVVALEQIQMILDNCARRSETEAAYLVIEMEEMAQLAREATSAHPGEMDRAEQALAEFDANRTESLLLSELGKSYDMAAEALASATEELMDIGDTDLVDAAVAYMAGPRSDREAQAMVNWGLPGRG